MEKQETSRPARGQEQQNSTDKTRARPIREADGGASPPDGAVQSGRMEVAAEPSPDLRHWPAGGLPQAPTNPDDPELERVVVVAIFDEANMADDCAQDLERRGVDVGVRMLAYPSATEEAGAKADEQAPQRRLGGRVTLGATIGATAGLLASTFVVPEAGTGVPAMLTTLVGAGLGSYWGRETGSDEQQAGARAGGETAAELRREGALVVARVDEDEADDVQDWIMRWNPVEVRVQ